MSHSSRIPLPSIVLVLTADHTRIPRPPSVIKFAAVPVPVIRVHPPQDSVEQTNLGDVRGPPIDDESMNEYCAPSVTSDEDDEYMELAESIYEAPIVEQERFVVVKFIKERMSQVLFSFRRLLCVDFPQTCFPGITRQ